MMSFIEMVSPLFKGTKWLKDCGLTIQNIIHLSHLEICFYQILRTLLR